MRRKTAIVIALGALIIGAWAAGLYASNSQDHDRSPRSQPVTRSRSSRAMPIPDKPGQPTRLQIDVFELTCTNAQVAALDLDTIIANDAKPSVILERLSKIGTTRLLVRMDDTVDLLQPSCLTHGKQIPIIRDIVVIKGVQTPSFNYEDVGFIANINGRWRGNDSSWADIGCKLDLSNATQTSMEVASEIKLPAIIRFKVEKTMAVRNGKPVFTMSNGQPLPGDKQGMVNVILIRLQAIRLVE